MIVAALLILLVLACLAGCAVIAAKPKARHTEARVQREIDTLAAQATLYEAMRKDRTHMYDRRRYEAAVTYVSPEKTEQAKPANVTKLRRKS